VTRKSETIETLKAMRVKLAAGWTRDAAARDARGRSVNSDDEKACSYCLLGALWSMEKYRLEPTVEAALLRTLKKGGVKDQLATYNDTPGRTQEEILALVDKTIERLEKQ